MARPVQVTRMVNSGRIHKCVHEGASSSKLRDHSYVGTKLQPLLLKLRGTAGTAHFKKVSNGGCIPVKKGFGGPLAKDETQDMYLRRV